MYPGKSHPGALFHRGEILIFFSAGEGAFAQHVFLRAGFYRIGTTMTLQRIQLSVNGRPVEKEVETRKNLADFLRHDLSLTGTHVGCEHGVCGSCTVLYDGEPVRSCLLLAVQADQAEITTVEGLAENGSLNSLQQAFKRHHALQCGFCTPGFLHDCHRVAPQDWPFR